MKSIALEFLPVVMAGGKGSRISEITTNKPKCLLPIANRPLLWYSLQFLENAGFNDVVVIVLDHQKPDIMKALDRYDIKLRIDYVCIPPNEDWGTADSLGCVSDRSPHKDLLVMSCDFITDVCIQGAVNLFRANDATLVALIFDQFRPDEPVVIPGPKSKQKLEKDIIAIDAKTNCLVLLNSSSDFDENVTLKTSTLKLHANTFVSTALLDAHFYLLKRWTVDYLRGEKSFNTLKGEFLPHIIKKQHSRIKSVNKKSTDETIANINESNTKKDLIDYVRGFGSCDLSEKVGQMSTTHRKKQKFEYYGDVVKCYAHLVTQSNYFGLRINTLASYCAITSCIRDKWELITRGKSLVNFHPNASIKTKQIDDASMVDDGAIINEKTSVKACAIGANTVVENRVRLTNCVIMQDVIINENCSLTNCIICDGAVVESGVTLKDCLIGNGHTVSESHTNEILTSADRLMEI